LAVCVVIDARVVMAADPVPPNVGPVRIGVAEE
jgi:hypothetical protein